LPLVQSNELFFDTGLHSYFGFSGGGGSGGGRGARSLFLLFFSIIPLNINPLNSKVMNNKKNNEGQSDFSYYGLYLMDYLRTN